MNARVALWSMRLDGVVPFFVERVAGDVEGCHVLVGDPILPTPSGVLAPEHAVR